MDNNATNEIVAINSEYRTGDKTIAANAVVGCKLSISEKVWK